MALITPNTNIKKLIRSAERAPISEYPEYT
jgi:hypothetical protein